jgi:serine/threonine protein kinase/Tfp pilus assembly protein PilF
MNGKVLGHYQILEKLGSGGMGIVYKAEDTALERYVALKFLPADVLNSPAATERLLREARAAAALNHPNICVIHEIGMNEGQHFIAMELLEGQNLRQRIAGSRFTTEELLDYAVQIASALDEAHKKGVIHRDIKPANIFITQNDQIKLLDFGLAKQLVQRKITSESTASTDEFITTPGSAVGTVAYMSPEQARGEELDTRTDLFSFGVVLYEMATGRQAFSGSTSAVIFDSILHKVPLSPVRVNPDIPDDLERIINKTIEKERRLRYQSASELRSDLHRLKRDRDSGGRPVSVVSETVDISSVAVLPFVNMSGDKEQEYFSDGLTEEIINALTHIRGLKVTARTSAFAFKDKREDIRRIAEVLGVVNILEGSVRKAGNRVRITAQLITAADGNTLWSERFDREMTDVFAIQDEIAQSIAEKLHIRISGKRPAARRHTENVEAYSLYFKGRHHFYKSTLEGVTKAKEYFEKALTVDPDYALAWYGLSKYYWYMGFGGLMDRKSAHVQAGQAASKALQINNMLPESHAVLGMLRAAEYDWKGAEREFRSGFELDPRSDEVLINHSWCYLTPMRRLNEAIAAMRTVLELDPLSVVAHIFLGWFHWFIGELDDAIEHFRNALEIDPTYPRARMFLGQVLIKKGMVDEGIQAYDTDAKNIGVSPVLAYAMAGQTQKARDLLEHLHTHPEIFYVPTSFAQVHFVLGEIDQGFDWMEKAVDEHDEQIYFILSNNSYDYIRSHPRYHALLRKMNLAP